jgi:hypothetical protein
MKKPALSPGVVRAALPLVVVVAAVVAGVVFGLEISLLVVAGGALLGVVALLWASVQSLTGESPLTLEEALGLGAPSAEEEQKRAVLRALKDLEFERGVGKISEEDYAELSARYREEAKRLMQLLDLSSEPARDRVDKLVAERLAKAKASKQRAAEKAREEERDADEPNSSDLDGESADTDDAPASSAPERDAPERDAKRAPADAEPPLEESRTSADDAPPSTRAREEST